MHNHGQPCAQLRENSVLNIQHSQNKEHFHHHCDWWSKSLSWDHANLSPLSPGETMTQWLVPKNCREMLFYMSHYNFMARDLGVDKILHQLMAHFYWPGLHSDVPQMCESYSKCQLVKASKGTPKVRLPSIKIFLKESEWIWSSVWEEWLKVCDPGGAQASRGLSPNQVIIWE